MPEYEIPTECCDEGFVVKVRQVISREGVSLVEITDIPSYHGIEPTRNEVAAGLMRVCPDLEPAVQVYTVREMTRRRFLSVQYAPGSPFHTAATAGLARGVERLGLEREFHCGFVAADAWHVPDPDHLQFAHFIGTAFILDPERLAELDVLVTSIALHEMSYEMSALQAAVWHTTVHPDFDAIACAQAANPLLDDLGLGDVFDEWLGLSSAGEIWTLLQWLAWSSQWSAEDILAGTAFMVQACVADPGNAELLASSIDGFLYEGISAA